MNSSSYISLMENFVNKNKGISAVELSQMGIDVSHLIKYGAVRVVDGKLYCNINWKIEKSPKDCILQFIEGSPRPITLKTLKTILSETFDTVKLNDALTELFNSGKIYISKEGYLETSESIPKTRCRPSLADIIEAIETYQALDFDDLQEIFDLDYTELVKMLRQLEQETGIYVDWNNRVVELTEIADDEFEESYNNSYWNLFKEEDSENLEIFLVRRRMPSLNSVLKKIKSFALITSNLDISLTCSPKYLLEQLPEVKRKIRSPFIIIGGCNRRQGWRYLNNYIVEISCEDVKMTVNFAERVAELDGIWLVTPKYITNSLRLIPHSETESKILKAKGDIIKL